MFENHSISPGSFCMITRILKITKAKKRTKVIYPTRKSTQPTEGNNAIRTVAIVIIMALAASAVAYLIVNRKRAGGAEITTPSRLKYTDMVVGTGATHQKG